MTIPFLVVHWQLEISYRMPIMSVACIDGLSALYLF